MANTIRLMVVATVLLAQGAISASNSTQTAEAHPRQHLSTHGTIVLIGIIGMILGMAFNLIGSLVSLFGLSTLFALLGIINTADLFSGMVNRGMLTICLMFVIVHPIAHLAVARRFIAWLLTPKQLGNPKHTDTNEAAPVATPETALRWARANLCFFGWAVSPLLENVPHVAVVTPVVANVSKEFGLSASQLLMPMSMAICSSNWLITGSASNLIIQSLMTQAGQPEMGFFELLRSNFVVSLLLQPYFIFAAPYFLPTGNATKPTPPVTNQQANVHGGDSVPPQPSGAAGQMPSPTSAHARPLAAAIAEQRLGAHEQIVMFLVTDEHSGTIASRPVADWLTPFPSLRSAANTIRVLGLWRMADQSRSLRGSFARAHRHDGGDTPVPMTTSAGDAAANAGGTQADERHQTSPPPEGSHAARQSPTPRLSRRGSSADLHLDVRTVEMVMTPQMKVASGDVLCCAADTSIVARISAVSGLPIVAAGTVAPRSVTGDDSPRAATIVAAETHAADSAYLPMGLCALRYNTKSQDQTSLVSVIVSNLCRGVGQRLSSNAFTGHYGVAVLSVRTELGLHLYGPGLLMHSLTAGDTLLLRAHPDFVAAYHNTFTPEFYVVLPIDAAAASHDAAPKTKLLAIPACIANLEVVRTSSWVTTRGDTVYFEFPPWYENMTIAVFVVVVVAAADEADLLLACALGVCFLVAACLIPAKEAVQYVDWSVYVTGAMAFGVGVAMTKSGLATFCGQLLLDTGATGFWLLAALAFLTALISNVVSNKGSIQVMFPIALSIAQTQSLPMMPLAVTIANAAMGGFMTPYGSGPSLIIAGPGNYLPKDYIMYGAPLTVLYTLLSAGFTSFVYDFW
jgi:di/tricarboxylate transporter